MTTLLIDVNNVGNRMFFAIPALFRNNDPEQGRAETIYGVLREVISLLTDFEPCDIAFFFDSNTSKRKEVLPCYKIRRDEIRQGLAGSGKDKKHLTRQLALLRKHVLPELGFVNIFMEEGFEADDLIAAAMIHLTAKREGVIIVSSDKDFYQLLGPFVEVYDPAKKKIWTPLSFVAEYGIYPDDWVRMKAITGCSSDDIPGVEGVGNISALKWVKGELASDTKMGKRIVAGGDIINRNKKLIRLPYQGTPPIEFGQDEMTWGAWPKVLKKVGIKLEVPSHV